MPAWPSHKVKGFTLVELMVTLTVVAILGAVAVPSFRTFLQNQRRSSAVSDLVLALNLARSEAVKQNTAAGVAVTAGATWTQGWRVCCAAAAVISTVPPLNANTTLSATNNNGAVFSVAFVSNGALLNPQGTVLFTFCDVRGVSSGTAVEVSPQGRIATGARLGYRVDQTTALAAC